MIDILSYQVPVVLTNLPSFSSSFLSSHASHLISPLLKLSLTQSRYVDIGRTGSSPEDCCQAKPSDELLVMADAGRSKTPFVNFTRAQVDR